MKRFHIAIGACCLALTAARTLSAGTIMLDFSAPVPGTLNDKNGLGTGFTTRVPGSGSGIPANDPNLTLDAPSGHLVVGSTRSDFNTTGFGRNLASMEAPALLLSGIGSGNFEVQAHYLDLHVDQLSDQIGILVGASVDNVVRGGVFEDNPDNGYQASFVYSQNGVDGSPDNSALAAFQPGQDALFDFGRTAGVWHFRWQNLSNPSNSGSFENIMLPGLDSQTDLYVGIFNHDARNATPQNATLDSFIVRTGVDAPEPSSAVLLVIGAVGLSLRRAPRSLSNAIGRAVKCATGTLGLAFAVFGLCGLTCEVVDAEDKAVKEVGIFTVRLASVSVAPVDLVDKSGGHVTERKYLKVQLVVENKSEVKKTEFSGFSQPHSPTLSDEFDNGYKQFVIDQRDVSIVGQWKGEPLYPMQVASDVLVFEVPVDKAKMLTLVLDGRNLGENESISFDIPRSAIKGAPKPLHVGPAVAKVRQSKDWQELDAAIQSARRDVQRWSHARAKPNLTEGNLSAIKRNLSRAERKLSDLLDSRSALEASAIEADAARK